MKYLILVLLLLFPILIYSNISTGFTFSQPVSTYTSISGGTVLGDINNDDQLFLTDIIGSASNQTSTGFPIGFTFNYDGINYTQFGVSSNGYIKLGNLPTFSMNCNGYYGDMSSTGDGLLIGGCVNDLQGQTGSTLQYLTNGSAPNRILTIQWSNYRLFGASGENINFQIVLYETSNIIELSYGSFTYGTGQGSWEATSMTGLYGSNNSDYFLRTSITDWTSTTNAGSNNSSITYNGTSLPTNNLLFRYTPISTLPIELISFTGRSENTENILTWKVASQVNNDKFIIEKSDDVSNWNILNTVKGSGTISKELDYYVIDTDPYFNTYYRLSQCDYDGYITRFEIISVNNYKVYKNPVIYPNPANDILMIDMYSNTLNTFNIKIYNIDGEIVIDKNVTETGNIEYILGISYLSQGLYFIDIISNSEVIFSNKFIKH